MNNHLLLYGRIIELALIITARIITTIWGIIWIVWIVWRIIITLAIADMGSFSTLFHLAIGIIFSSTGWPDGHDIHAIIVF